MKLLPEPGSTGWSFPFTEQDWDQTLPAVQAYLHTLHHELGQFRERVERLEARLKQESTTSSKPPSSDSPDKKPRRRTGSATRTHKGGGKPGHAGHRQVLLAPTSVEEVLPEWCACGSGDFDLIQPYYTHQEIELPPIEMEVTHWVLHQRRCLGCGRWHKAQVPAEHVTGYGPRLSALMAELAGTYGNGQPHGANVLCVGARGPDQLRRHSEGYRPGDLGDRSLLHIDRQASASGAGWLY